ncbi:helix-turn-helix domain-containing protein [Candidatus Hamiltonella endosymbiont of Tuberolachnus salignus]|uniref:helix-turn-helix transcriptional regulator n=1 Tax=Candidatus Williamhamiltonella endosymbiont of Tuberolachnus salignus TaxID=3077954 RepID=UPI0030CF7A80
MNNAMKQLCLSCTIPSGFTNAESEVYSNVAMTELFALTDECSKVLDVFRSQKEAVCRKKCPLSLLSTLPCFYKHPSQPWLFDFFPLFDEQNGYIGAFFHARPFLFLSPLEYVEAKSPHKMTLRQTDKRFNQRECEIIFFTLQRLSKKEVARKLNLSYRTIENKLQSIYEKAGVQNGQQFTDYFCTSGMNQYLPPELLPSGRHVISV